MKKWWPYRHELYSAIVSTPFNDQKVSEDVVQKLNQLVIDAIGKQVTATYVKDLKAVWNILTCQYNSRATCVFYSTVPEKPKNIVTKTKIL
jgi:hypothetical protein